MKRFYKTADTLESETGFLIVLDGRAVRTPAGAQLSLSNAAAARLLADEWASQGEQVVPDTMPLTKLLNVAIDRTPSAREGVADKIASYGETDTLCHLADEPEGLRERQALQWTPLRDWAEEALGVRLVPVHGVVAADQPPESLARLRALALEMDDVRLTALAHAVALLGSAILGFALARGRLDADAAFALSFLDALYQAEQWGEDAEAAARRDAALEEVRALSRLFVALAD